MDATGWRALCRAAKLCRCQDQRRVHKGTAEVADSAFSEPSLSSKPSIPMPNVVAQNSFVLDEETYNGYPTVRDLAESYTFNRMVHFQIEPKGVSSLSRLLGYPAELPAREYIAWCYCYDLSGSSPMPLSSGTR